MDAPRLTAEVLLAHVLEVSRVRLYVDLDRPLEKEELATFRALIERRTAGEPTQYLTGVREFYSRPFKVDARVLIPRPETELLVEAALHALPKDAPGRALDVCTGSGCIALSLAAERPQATVRRHGPLDGRAARWRARTPRRWAWPSGCRCCQGDLFAPLPAGRAASTWSSPTRPTSRTGEIAGAVARGAPRAAAGAGRRAGRAGAASAGSSAGARASSSLAGCLHWRWARPRATAVQALLLEAAGYDGRARGEGPGAARAPRFRDTARGRSRGHAALEHGDHDGQDHREGRPAAARARWRSPARRTPRCPSSPPRCWRTASSTYRNVPDLADVRTMLKLLRTMGCERRAARPASRSDVCEVRIDGPVTPEAPYELVKTMRASRAGARARWSRATAAPACRCPAAAPSARARSISTSRASRRWARRSRSTEGYVEARAQAAARARTVSFDMLTVTGTENLMMAAALAKGRTVLENCAREPEVEELGAGAQQDGRAHRGRRHRRHHHRGRGRAAAGRPRHHPGPHRGRHAPGRGRDHRRRRAGDATPSPSTSRRSSVKLREAGCTIERRGRRRCACQGPATSAARSTS